MSARFQQALEELRQHPRTWLITGAAGFIGSNLVETLLNLNQRVVGLDNFSTGYARNCEDVRCAVGETRWARMRLIEGDIRDLEVCRAAVAGVDHVLHQAALGSVPRSLDDPITSSEVNVAGSLNMLVAARDAKVKSYVYAASSSTYGDHPGLPKVEDQIGRPLSPYAVTKYVNELYADVFARAYGFMSTGLRYFNVFGPRQYPSGAYAAVIPKWTAAMIQGETIYINGDGETTRDFCYVANVVQANLLAALAKGEEGKAQIYNVAAGSRTSLNALFEVIKANLATLGYHYTFEPVYQEFRVGDVRHSQADITRIREQLGFNPSHTFADGIKDAVRWYVSQPR